MDPGFRSRLTNAIALWNSAERVIKQAEFIGRKIVLPSINELRYAGRWLNLALDAYLSGREKIDEITSAEDAVSYACLCCIQAKHDAIDSIVLFMHEKVSQLSDRYTNRLIAMYVKDYDQFLLAIDQVDRSILASRESRQDRVELYDAIVRDHLPMVMDFYDKIGRAETLINEQLEAEKQKLEMEEARHASIVEGLKSESSRNRRYFYISVAFNVILLVVGIVALIPLLHDASQRKHEAAPLTAAASPSNVIATPGPLQGAAHPATPAARPLPPDRRPK